MINPRHAVTVTLFTTNAAARRCKCESGKIVKCCRLRKEFTDMSHAERVRYIKTVKTASTNSAYKSQYDKLLRLHKTLFSGKIHDKDFFLPWHRWYILQYENLLRQIDCRVTVPYWDSSLVAGDPWSSSLWNTGDDGFGGNGVPGGRCVNTGPFRSSVWSLPASAVGNCLKRDFKGIVPNAIAVKDAITTWDIHEFELKLRVNLHNRVHCRIHGTMCSRDAATAPEFFPHHGFIDKIWWDWQKKSHLRKFHRHFRDKAETMSSTSYRPRDFLDLNDQPDCVCVEYLDPKNSVYKKIQGLSSTTLSRVPRLPLPELSEDAKKLFGVTQAETRKLSMINEKINPGRFLVKSSLHGKDAVLGFKLKDLQQVSDPFVRRAPDPRWTGPDHRWIELGPRGDRPDHRRIGFDHRERDLDHRRFFSGPRPFEVAVSRDRGGAREVR